MTYTGRMSTFGGPDDHGVGLTEGLALVELADLSDLWFGRLFLAPLVGGLARSLNPEEFYCAMRWNQFALGVDRETLRRGIVQVTAHGRTCFVQPIDYGPGDGSIVDGVRTENTGRLIDLSPGAAQYLGCVTDDVVTCTIIMPQAPGAPAVLRAAPAAAGGKEVA